MRIALCISGQVRLRAMIPSIASLRDHIIDKFPGEVDVYGAFWDEPGARGISGFLPDSSVVSFFPPDMDVAGEFLEEYKPKYIQLLKEKELDTVSGWDNRVKYILNTELFKTARGLTGRPRVHSLKMFRLIYECDKLRLASNKQYDVVIRTRPDICLGGTPSFDVDSGSVYMESEFVAPNFITAAHDRKFLSDQFFYGSPVVMQKISEVWLKLADISYKQEKRTGILPCSSVLAGESVLIEYLDRIERIPIVPVRFIQWLSEERRKTVNRAITYIAHRGNLNGPNPERENHPTYLLEALKAGFHAEADIWFVGKLFYLGHDGPQHVIHSSWLRKHKNNLWIHAKDITTMRALSSSSIQSFFHQDDDMALTTKGAIWAFANRSFPLDSYVVDIDGTQKHRVIPECVSGVCSDYVADYKRLLG